MLERTSRTQALSSVKRDRNSASVSCQSIGAAAAASIAPSKAVSKSGPSGIATATTSPGPTPALRRACATAAILSARSWNETAGMAGANQSGRVWLFVHPAGEIPQAGRLKSVKER